MFFSDWERLACLLGWLPGWLAVLPPSLACFLAGLLACRLASWLACLLACLLPIWKKKREESVAVALDKDVQYKLRLGN